MQSLCVAPTYPCALCRANFTTRQNVLEVLAFGLFFKLWFVALIIGKARKSVKLRKHERRAA